MMKMVKDVKHVYRSIFAFITVLCFFFVSFAYTPVFADSGDIASDVIEGVLSRDDYADVVGAMFGRYTGQDWLSVPASSAVRDAMVAHSGDTSSSLLAPKTGQVQITDTYKTALSSMGYTVGDSDRLYYFTEGNDRYFLYRNNSISDGKSSNKEINGICTEDGWGVFKDDKKGGFCALNKSGDLVLSSDCYRDMMAALADQYVPFLDRSYKKWSYDSCSGTKSTSAGNGYNFSPHLLYSPGEILYVMAFLRLGDTIYFSQQFRMITSDDENINLSVYNFSDGTATDKRITKALNIKDYPYMGVFAYQSFAVKYYKLSENYQKDLSHVLAINENGSSVSMLSSGSEALTGSFGSLRQDKNFHPDTVSSDDYGYLYSSTPFKSFANSGIDFKRIPGGTAVKVGFDSLDTFLINPKNDKPVDLPTFVNDDYEFTDDVPDVTAEPSTSDYPDGPITSGVKVSGNVKVDGEIKIKADPIDINVNVNSGSNANAGDFIDPGTVDTNLDHYLEQVPELSKGFVDYLKDFLAWLPPEIYGLIILGLIVVVWCRLAGR